MMQIFTSTNHIHKLKMMPILIVLIVFCFQLFLDPKLSYALGLGSPVAEQLYYISFLVFVFFWICSIFLFLRQVVRLSQCLYNKRWTLCVDMIVDLILLCLVLVVAENFDHRCPESLLDGFTKRLSQKADIRAIQKWAEDFGNSDVMTNKDNSVLELDISACQPDSIRALNPTNVRWFGTPSGPYVLRLYFGGQLHPRWGVDFVDSHVPLYFFEKFALLTAPQYRRELKPNIYLWYQLDD